MTVARSESVAIDVALPRYLQGVKKGETVKQIAEALGMKPDSLSVKISDARTKYMIATRIYADPNDAEKTVTGAELMARENLAARELKKLDTFKVITEGTIFPSASNGGGQRSTGGVAGLVSLMDSLMAADEDGDEDEAETPAETAENAEGETSEDSDESAE